ncbi:MAG: V-type ATP synthase subunit C [Candidatus Methanofastidiosum methylothiophilum]|uniref:A-type ATP synthase subunit C n=1 Tax=Candidatus Methanofastidiosum methylothiophilum TaxID=1705564 RepID=A0A150IKV3_9EURY|nr:MAG: V-type ATP synthase subunit C [Candidatus Methanofastidiosum methylthiophilus]KYC47703.1 MAG: V-type ATP synthase subunit C [Candidatus Methanofastidiosum methylthiophilus]KYC50291.1 MAG: V-type ATP synthase subunit C [Candidatus Methanofastidiosum methylthiophilus]
MDLNVVSSEYWLGETNYSYLNTRVRAMESNLFRSDVYMKLLNMEVSQIARFLGEGNYKEEIESLSREYRGVELIEHSINKNLGKTYNKLIKMSGKKASKYAFAILTRWDIHNIISVLRGKYSKATAEEIERTLIPIGELPFSLIQSLVKIYGYEDVIKRLKKIEQFDFLDETKGIADIESELFKMYYKKILETFKKENKSLFIQFLRTEIDIINIKNIMRMRRYGFAIEEEEKNMVEGGLFLNIENLSSLLREPEKEFLKRIKKTPYGSIIEKHWQEKTLFYLEESLEKYLMECAKEQFIGDPFTIMPVLHYIISKKIEVENIRKISRGKASNLEIKIIEDSLVI